MKNYRLDFSKGINFVSDKAVLQPGYVTVADGIDLRSGTVRAFQSHTFVSDATTTANCLFSYRNKFYQSDAWRDYVVETVAGQDRIYFTEYGSTARKIIEGTEVPLGTPAPSIPPTAISNSVSSLILNVEGFNTGGIFPTGTTRSYRLAVETIDGVQPPTPAKIVIFTNTPSVNTHSTHLTWNSYDGAIKYKIFAGDSGNEKLALDLNPSVLAATDDGSWPSGEAATVYDDASVCTYCYTFLRDVKGVINESGPSPLSIAIPTDFGKNIIFDINNDGFFSDTTKQVLTSVTTSSTLETSTPSSISSVYVNSIMNTTLINLSSSIDIQDGDKIVIYKDSDVKTYDANLGSSNTEVLVDEALSWLDTSYTVMACKTYFSFTTPTYELETGTVVQIVCDYPEFTNGTFKATLEASAPGTTLISIPKFTSSSSGVTITSITYVPHNGYIKYRNLYRIGPAGGFLLVKQVPVWEEEFSDTIAVENLGSAISSSYKENGVNVLYSPPPIGMRCLTQHYGMLFGIIGNKVRWTPTGEYDAWPETFQFSYDFEPVALASYAGALIVLCNNELSRIDGSVPTQLAPNGTLAKDGCIAPHSVCTTTDSGLLYLSRRGVMAFNGMESACVTDQVITSRFFTAPSYKDADVTTGLIPTLGSYNYAASTYEDGISHKVNIGFAQHANHIAPGLVNDIKAFIWNGRYIMYWTNTSGNYGAHTCVCIDLKANGKPVTTLPYHLKAAHVNEFGRCFAIMNDVASNPMVTTVTITHEVDPYSGGG